MEGIKGTAVAEGEDTPIRCIGVYLTATYPLHVNSNTFTER